MSADQFIERRIVTGFIVSTDYIRQVRKTYSPKLIESSTANQLIGWCVEYFDKYDQAPGREIEAIFASRMKNLDKDRVEDIEEILEGLSDEYDREQFNVTHLLDQTKQYFKTQHLNYFAEEIQGELEAGNLSQAEALVSGYTPLSEDAGSIVDPFSDSTLMRQAFEEPAQPLVHFGRALGDFWNDQFTRDSLIGFMGPDKSGKTFLLMEIGVRAAIKGCNVVFFQAGDMTLKQQVRRLGIYLAKRSDKPKYCGQLYVPVIDCIRNQFGTCDRKERESDIAPFEGMSVAPKDITYNLLKEAFHDEENEDYTPCKNCRNLIGAPWFKLRPPVEPLTWKEGAALARQFRKKRGKRFKLATYPNETLSVAEIKTQLHILEKQQHFIPDVIVIDYADILAPDPDYVRMEFRHQQNRLWQRLRALSQEWNCLVVTATQTSAEAYKTKGPVTRSHFSEDKRKLAHVTSMYGLNQNDEEKKIGVMRFNKIVVREDEFYVTDQVKVLQRLQMGKPILASYK